MFQLKRYEKNPVLEPLSGSDWEDKAVFNPAVQYKDGITYLLYRAVGEYENYVSRIGLATSEDGFNFTRVSDKPVLEPEASYECGAIEDPRATVIDGKIYITYTTVKDPINLGGDIRGVSNKPIVPAVALAETTDCLSYKRLGVISPPNVEDKNAVMFSEKVDGRFACLHRPHRWSKIWLKNPLSEEIDLEYPCPKEDLPELPSVWIMYSDDLKNWGDHKLVFGATHENDEKIGAGVPPIKTDAGWVLIYHHVDRVSDPVSGEKMRVYSAHAALLDLKDPSKVLSKTPSSILAPKEWYERQGDVHNVVFPTGGFVKDDKLFVYYGAADKFCAVATGSMSELISELLIYKHLD